MTPEDREQMRSLMKQMHGPMDRVMKAKKAGKLLDLSLMKDITFI